MKRPLFVAITGDIASGKSLAAKYYKKHCSIVYSADEIVHTLLEKSSTIKALKKLITGDFITAEQIDRAKLRQIVFSDPVQLKKLNSYIHPQVLKTIKREINKHITHPTHPIVFFEIPLLFECSLQHSFDINILITAETDTKIHRIVQRDKCTKKQAKAILDKQMPQEKKKAIADIVITNDCDKQVLYTKLKTLFATFPYIRKRRLKEINYEKAT